MNRARIALSLPLALAACGDDGGALAPDAGLDADSEACPRPAAPADRDRFAVVAHPFAEGGGASPRFEVVALSSGGELSQTGHVFELGGRAPGGRIAFTPDGEVGIAPLDDGSLGVFTLAADGEPTVVHARFAGDFYASAVRMAPSGDRVLVLDSQFRENGGGIYALSIGCDGSLTEEGQLVAAKLAAEILPLEGERAAVPADDFADSPPGSDLHLVELGAGGARWIAGAPLFGGTEAIVGSAALGASGRHVLVGDTCGFCSEPNRIAVAEIEGDELSLVQTLSPFEDPHDLIASPFDDRFLAVSGFGDALFEIAPSGEAGRPFAAPVELTYQGAPPQLPGRGVMIDRGALRGLVLVAENLGLRALRFRDGESIEDLGLFPLGEGSAAITGALGLQP